MGGKWTTKCVTDPFQTTKSILINTPSMDLGKIILLCLTIWIFFKRSMTSGASKPKVSKAKICKSQISNHTSERPGKSIHTCFPSTHLMKNYDFLFIYSIRWNTLSMSIAAKIVTYMLFSAIFYKKSQKRNYFYKLLTKIGYNLYQNNSNAFWII